MHSLGSSLSVTTALLFLQPSFLPLLAQLKSLLSLVSNYIAIIILCAIVDHDCHMLCVMADLGWSWLILCMYVIIIMCRYNIMADLGWSWLLYACCDMVIEEFI